MYRGTRVPIRKFYQVNRIVQYNWAALCEAAVEMGPARGGPISTAASQSAAQWEEP